MSLASPAERDERSNAEWLELLRQPAACASAVRELGDYLRRGLARVLRERRDLQEHDLDDIVQETLLRIVGSLDRFRGDSRFTTWALAVGTRVAFSELRRRKVRRRECESFEALSEALRLPDAHPEPAPQDVAERHDLLHVLRHSIQHALTERQRLAVAAELAGIPTLEIAERLGTNQNALYKLHHDARKKLRAALEAAGFAREDVQRRLAQETAP